MRKNRMTFEDWIQPSRPKPPAKIGLSYRDLSDCCYADPDAGWYESCLKWSGSKVRREPGTQKGRARR